MRLPLPFQATPVLILLGGLATLAYLPSGAASPPNRDPVIVGAGDIATAGGAQGQTAALISAVNPTAVFTLGDNAYESGALSEYQSYYDPSWGRFNSIVHPVPGNHDYKPEAGTAISRISVAALPLPTTRTTSVLGT